MTTSRRLATLLILVVLGLGGGLWLGSPGIAADSPRCAVAQALVDQAKPETAAALVDKVREDAKDPALCAAAASAAATAINAAATILRLSEAKADALPAKYDPELNPDWEQIQKDAQRAHALDSENPEGAALVKKAAAQLEGPKQQNWWDRLLAHGKAWKDLAKEHADEWAALVGAALGTASLVVLAARLLLLLPSRKHVPPRFGNRKHLPSIETLTAVFLTTAALATALWLPSNVTKAHTGRVIGLVVLDLLALLLTWSWLYHRQRVVIEMLTKGDSSKEGATAMVAHLRRLGASPPKGLQIPLGTDVETLEGSNISSGGLAGRFLRTLQTALAVTPWRVRVDKSADNSVQIVISRHGRLVTSEVLLPPERPVQTIPLDYEKLAAACVLLTLLKALDNFRGLGGARDWRSVGLHYDASTGDHPAAQKLALLSQAVTIDPQNWAAQMTYRLQLDGISSKTETLLELTKWLFSAAKQLEPGDEALKARMLYSAYAMRLNWGVRRGSASDTEPATSAAPATGQAQQADPEPKREDIRKSFCATLKDKNLDPLFVSRIETAFNAMASEGEPYGEPRRDLALDPQTAYVQACWAANKGEPSTAVTLLRFAGPHYQEKAQDDPSLIDFRKTEVYLREFGTDPRTELTDFLPFSAAKDRLVSAGLTQPEALVDLRPRVLAATAGIRVSGAFAWLQRAKVPLAVPEPLSKFRMEIAETLADRGVVSPEALASLRNDPILSVEARAAIVESLEPMKAYTEDKHRAALNQWLPG